MSEHRITYVTAPAEVAEQIANTLVEDKLAMCINIIERIRSIYRWEGRVEHATEALLIIKSPAAKIADLIEKVREIHPYEVPEIISFDITAGNPDYLDWLSGKEIVIADMDEESELEDEVEGEAEGAEDQEDKEKSEA